MVIVKFKDKTYGIRRDCRISASGFEFLDKRDNYWWAGAEYQPNYSFTKLEQAQARLEEYKNIKTEVPDYGEVISG